MRLIVITAVLSIFAAPALAAQGEVCSSAPASVSTPTPLNNDVVFKCKSAGEASIPDLYAKGWRVVSVFHEIAPVKGSPMPHAQWTAVIEKP
ncbi:hypothetical protein [Lysobacter sp. A03]|uniref:hypothetical protein n=1 Tax=Lysobacter sp. A03 TaxID=1199154 RepID=UPI000AF3BA54|nr:hypothetical protein [Lysobacter sp. A03]